jgi:uncharacterized Zn-binding protein involved in type VI secretion
MSYYALVRTKFLWNHYNMVGIARQFDSCNHLGAPIDDLFGTNMSGTEPSGINDSVTINGLPIAIATSPGFGSAGPCGQYDPITHPLGAGPPTGVPGPVTGSLTVSVSGLPAHRSGDLRGCGAITAATTINVFDATPILPPVPMFITIPGPPQGPPQGPAPFIVAFIDLSIGEYYVETDTTGIVTRWEWDFGDEDNYQQAEKYTEQFPIYTYKTPGTYTVSLMVWSKFRALAPLIIPGLVTVNENPNNFGDEFP